MGPVVEAVEASLTAASHVTDADQAAVEALRTLARKIDEDEARWALALRWAEEMKVRPPSMDNVSIPTLLKYCESLGLTPAGRVKLGEKKPEAKGGTLSVLRDGAKAARGKAG